MPPVAFGHGFSRLCEVSATGKGDNQNTQDDNPNGRDGNVLHHFFLLQHNNPAIFPAAVILNITHPAGIIAIQSNSIISVAKGRVNAKRPIAMVVGGFVVEKAFCGRKAWFFWDVGYSTGQKAVTASC